MNINFIRVTISDYLTSSRSTTRSITCVRQKHGTCTIPLITPSIAPYHKYCPVFTHSHSPTLPLSHSPTLPLSHSALSHLSLCHCHFLFQSYEEDAVLFCLYSNKKCACPLSYDDNEARLRLIHPGPCFLLIHFFPLPAPIYPTPPTLPLGHPSATHYHHQPTCTTNTNTYSTNSTTQPTGLPLLPIIDSLLPFP